MRKLLIGLILCVASFATSAQQTYALGFSGSGSFLPSGFECSPICTPTTFPWTGAVTLTTSSAADGVYTDADLPNFNFQSSFGGFSSFNTDGFGAGSFYGPSSVTATVADHTVTGISARFWTSPWTVFTLTGLNVQLQDGLDFGGYPAHHAGLVNATAVLTPVPEPSTWALMMLGLAGAVGIRRYKRT
ncbi:PEP-CTERM sorting domain-containing protein [Rhizobacter fulvus]